MTSKWILTVSVVVAAGVLAYGLTRYAACRAASPGMDRFQDVSFLAQELRLTESQMREIKGLQMTLSTGLKDCCERHCAARARLGQALAAETNGDAQAEAVLTEMCRAYEEGERATLAHIRQVRAMLTLKQRRRFDALITKCLCRTCCRGNGGSPADAPGNACSHNAAKGSD